MPPVLKFHPIATVRHHHLFANTYHCPSSNTVRRRRRNNSTVRPNSNSCSSPKTSTCTFRRQSNRNSHPVASLRRPFRRNTTRSSLLKLQRRLRPLLPSSPNNRRTFTRRSSTFWSRNPKRRLRLKCPLHFRLSPASRKCSSSSTRSQKSCPNRPTDRRRHRLPKVPTNVSA